MEEKERYEWNSRFDEAIKDNQTGDIVNAVEVLNKQDNRIKELEEELAKQKEKYDKLYGCYKKTSNEDLYDKYRLAEETTQLKHQLHDLPKKIVKDFYDEIRHRAILEDDYCPDHNLERKYGVRKCLLENIRSTILKKYGVEDE